MKISIIIVNYNTAKFLESCINAVIFFEKKLDLEFIIVDNKSEDNSVEVIKKLTLLNKNVKGVFLDSNKGFAYANNRGVEKSHGDFILILNPDVVFTESILGKLMAHYQNLQPGILGVKLFGDDDIFQYTYYQNYPSILQYILFYSIYSKPFIKSKYFQNKFLYNRISSETNELIPVTQVPGAFMFFHKNTYKDFHGFNENYFLFFEDVDLCYRINKIHKLYIANIKVQHTGASSMFLNSNDKIYGLFIISFVKFFRNNYNYAKYIFIKLLVLENSILKIILENLRKIFGKSNPEIINVHKYILKNLNS